MKAGVKRTALAAILAASAAVGGVAPAVASHLNAQKAAKANLLANTSLPAAPILDATLISGPMAAAPLAEAPLAEASLAESPLVEAKDKDKPKTTTTSAKSAKSEPEVPIKIAKTVENSKARLKPDKDAPVKKVIKAGTEVTIVNVEGNWSKTKGGYWLLTDTLKTIKTITPEIAKPTQPVGPPANPGNPAIPKKVLLTYDDCVGNPSKMISVLDYAAAHNIGLMLFPTGECVEKYARWGYDLPDMIRSRGHWVGNHSYSHQELTKLTRAEAKAEILNGPKTNILRPPYGASDDNVKALANSLGYQLMFWTLDTEDWRPGHSASVIANYVVKNARPASNVLMHMQHEGFSTDTLYKIQTGLKARGLQLCAPAKHATPVQVPANFCS